VVPIPDGEARDFLAAAARGNDEASEYARVKAEHDASTGCSPGWKGEPR
jgi:hypothetical protein